MSKNLRTLDMYCRLMEGRVINKAEEAEHFGVDERTIKRDIEDMRVFLEDRAAQSGRVGREIVYSREKNGYLMTGNDSSMMTNSEILAVSKILLASRAFTKQEMGGILNKLVAGCVPLKNMKLVSELLTNEKFHYVELRHKSIIRDKLWRLGTNIREQEILKIRYSRQAPKTDPVERYIIPVAILFSEYYFYLNAFILDRDDQGNYSKRYDYPAVFRVDRISTYQVVGEKFAIRYRDRFEEGEFRKRVQFMYPGELIRMKLRINANAAEAVLDRLPTAKILEEKDGQCTVSAEVFGKGVVMWLLSQGKNVEVLSPESLRAEMKETLTEMLDIYQSP